MNHSALYPAGVQADQIRYLWWLMFWISALVFVTVLIFLLIAVFRRRPLVIIGRPSPPDSGRERRLTRTVSGAVALTVAILFVILFASFLSDRGISALAAPNPLMIEVVGHQWWWEIHYPNDDPSKIVQTANEIHIPIGRPVLVKLNARDVIHSFWVPALHGKRDLIPGQENEIWIQARTAGEYEGQCAEFCGHQHAHMRFRVFADPPDQFAAWLENQRQSSHVPENPEQVHGQQVFLGGSCILCHTIQGTAAAAANGPNLTHVASRYTLAAGTIPNTPGHLGGWIVDSQGIKPGNHMPPNNLDGDDLQDLLAYIESLK